MCRQCKVVARPENTRTLFQGLSNAVRKCWGKWGFQGDPDVVLCVPSPDEFLVLHKRVVFWCTGLLWSREVMVVMGIQCGSQQRMCMRC